MNYTISLICRAHVFRYYRIDSKLLERIKSSLKEDKSLDAIWNEYFTEKEWVSDDEIYWTGDRFGLSVEDEEGNTVFETEDENAISLLRRPRVPLLEKGYYFYRVSTEKGAGWTYYLETDEFDRKKLKFQPCTYKNEPFTPLTRLISNLSYDGNLFDVIDEDGFFEEQYWDTYVAKCDENGVLENVGEEDVSSIDAESL